jgi:hypothetical protein
VKARTVAAVAVLAAATAGLAACSSDAGSPRASASQQRAAAGMVMPDGSTMAAGGMTPGMVMPDGSTMAPGSPGTAPSKAAKMICTDETRDNIITVLSVTPEPNPVSTWHGGTYTCTYRFPMGPIVLSVHESADVPAAAAYTDKVRRTIPGAKDLVGLTQKAFGTKNGVVVLQKDNDTLRVDTSALRPQSDKLYAHRDTFAYEIATVIMGCWTGD